MQRRNLNGIKDSNSFIIKEGRVNK